MCLTSIPSSGRRRGGVSKNTSCRLMRHCTINPDILLLYGPLGFTFSNEKHDDLVRSSPECDSGCFYTYTKLDGTLIPLTRRVTPGDFVRLPSQAQKHSETVSVWSKNTAHQRRAGVEPNFAPNPVRHFVTPNCSNTAWIVFRTRELGYLVCQNSYRESEGPLERWFPHC